jgi:hypothetical protein
VTVLKRDQERACDVCRKPFRRGDRGEAAWARARYCSNTCRGIGITTLTASKVCDQCGDEFSRPRYLRLGPWAAQRFCSRRCMLIARNGRGENSPGWRGGVGGWHSTIDHREWADMVKERDDHTCQECGRIDKVQAHHMQPVSRRPDLARDIDNGTTLCASCHRRADARIRRERAA